MANITADLSIRLAALLTALTAITAEDIATIRANETLGPDVAANIESLQALALGIDQETIDLLNKARVDAGLEPL